MVESSSDLESSGSDLDSEPSPKKHHHANQSQASSEKMLRLLKATSHHVHSCHGKTAVDSIFVAHPDSSTSNHMTHKLELFDSASFKTLSKPLLISLGDDSKNFATRKGTLHLLFNVDGEQREGCFKDVLFVPDLKVMLLSVRQSACLPHCKVVFDNNICKYINKNTNKIIARVFSADNSDLYMLDVIPIEQKVTANLASPSFQSMDINILHRHLGHLGFDNCCLMVNCQLVDGVDKVAGKEAFCEGCVYGHSKQKNHLLTGTTTKHQLERVHIDLCSPIPTSISGNKYFLLIIDKHTHYCWVKFLPKKSDAFTQLKRWKVEAECNADQKLQYLKSDGGKEFRSKDFTEWLTLEGVIHEMSAPYEHKQNGLVKRGIQNVLQWAMCQLFGMNMSQGFWLYAVENVVYLINCSPTTTLKDKTPFEAWTGNCLSIKHLHTFDEMGYVHILPET